MAQDGLAGLSGKPLFAELARFISSPRIERGRGSADDVPGGVLAHVSPVCPTLLWRILAAIANEAKQSRAADAVWITSSLRLLANDLERLSTTAPLRSAASGSRCTPLS